MAIVIIYGPQGSGKTKHAQQLMRRFNSKRLVEDWSGLPADIAPKEGDIVLTHKEPPFYVKGASLFRIDQAMHLMNGGA